MCVCMCMCVLYVYELCARGCVISYAFNITLLIVIIVKDYLNGFMSIYVCFPRCSKTSDRTFY